MIPKRVKQFYVNVTDKMTEKDYDYANEILNKKDNIKKLLCVEKQYELMAIITIGYKDLTVNPHVRKRKNINEFILDWDE